MAQFLRDQFLKNLTISAETITQIYNFFDQRVAVLNGALAGNGDLPTRMLRYNVIRFDNKGYRVFSLQDLLSYFELAHTVERIVFTAEAQQSIGSNRVLGTYLELRLDVDSNSCVLLTSSDDKDWVDASFSAVEDIIARARNKHYLIRNGWTPLLVQIFGVGLGFIASLGIAAKVAPFIAIENALLISFLFAMIVFSNVWTPINNQIGRLINKAFPSIYFIRPKKATAHWLLQALVGGAAFALVVYVLSQAQGFLWQFVETVLLKK